MKQRLVRIVVLSALITAVGGGLTTPKSTSASKLFGGISTCGTISQPGTYFLKNSVGSPPASCMLIKASNVTFNLNKFSITGNAKIGRGITIDSGDKNVVVTNGRVSAYQVGIQDSGVNTHLVNLRIFNNVLRGVALEGATRSLIQNDNFPGNAKVSIFVNSSSSPVVERNSIAGSGKFGIWVRSSAAFNLNHNSVRQSGLLGIFVGCTGHGILNTLSCKRSSGGTIAYNQVVLSSHAGIAVDRGNAHLHIRYNNVSLSGRIDLYDSNPGCGTNSWSRDIFKTHSPPSCAN